MSEVLTELHDDMAHAAATLSLLAKNKTDDPTEAARLTAKAEGVRLAQSYVFDAMRRAGVAP